MPRHATPRHATPRHATPRHATPRHTKNSIFLKCSVKTSKKIKKIWTFLFLPSLLRKKSKTKCWELF
jgi:hypothetical protein